MLSVKYFIQFDSEENFTPLDCFKPSLFRELTYMSIRAVIKSHLEAMPPRLIQLLPAIDGDPVVRTMLLSPELDSLLLGPWETPTIERRCNRLRADLEVFVKGKRFKSV
jgi:hypothetical protein